VGGTNVVCKVLVEFAMNVRAVVIHDVLLRVALALFVDPSAEAPGKAYAPHPSLVLLSSSVHGHRLRNTLQGNVGDDVRMNFGLAGEMPRMLPTTGLL